MLNFIKEILFLCFPKRTPGSTLLRSGLALLSIFSITGFVIQFKTTNGLVFSFSDGDALPTWLVIIFILLSIILIVLGIVLIVLDWIKNRNEKKNKSKGITLLSLPISKPPQLEVQFYETIESSRTSQYSNLIKREGESNFDWLKRSERSLNEINNSVIKDLELESQNLILAVGAIAHVPQVFALGFLLGNRRNINYYCWDRDRNDKENNNWVDVRSYMGFRVKSDCRLIKSEGSSNIERMGLSIEVSMNNDELNFMKKLNLDAVAVVHINNKKIGNLFSYEAQFSLISTIRNYLNNDVFNKNKNIKELHITVMSQASFILRLASEFNQNHFPSVIKVHHYEAQEYPWCAVMEPGKSNVKFEIN